MKNPDIKIVPSGGAMRNSMMTHERAHLTMQARFALELVKSIVMSVEMDGETSAGHQKHKILTPTEAVSRTIETTEQIFEAIESKGWLLETPSLDELYNADTGQGKTGF